ncbi:hypothetical protein COLO4_09306 [Corchorus olitorius]|uniref:Uncharacterized protein n=1 Tax=Corchorus olitorius TaxID=93759 RepID=A0A1R3KCL1_9ROSI|nr:hypothetical protein COLO4_09306 [Corchorus olitorius]
MILGAEDLYAAPYQVQEELCGKEGATAVPLRSVSMATSDGVDESAFKNCRGVGTKDVLSLVIFENSSTVVGAEDVRIREYYCRQC